jgi:bifunctional enzyme CysN/CysC
MARLSDLSAQDVAAFLAQHEHKSLLRFITCGSVDDGKSTLIGRLLYDSGQVFDDQMQALESDSRKVGAQGGAIDYALLVDGLAAEREQGITIDVAYRYFTTAKRKFIVADTPGHEQYTRNMVTGASTADLAIILIDATKGILPQTRRHSFLVSLMGVRRIVLAINKMDLVGWSQAVFDAIHRDFLTFAAPLGFSDIQAIPLSGLGGDNVVTAGAHMPWYRGPALLTHLETVPLEEERALTAPFHMPVQWVNRPNSSFRGYAGLIASGRLQPGARVRVSPSGKTSTIARIVTQGGDLDEAVAGQAVTLTLTDEIDCSRGDVISLAEAPPQTAHQFEATVVWMAEQRLLPGRPYWLKVGTAERVAQITDIKYKINVNTFEHLAAKTLDLNDIAVCTIGLDQAIAFEPYATLPELGGFILIDRETNATVAAGLIRFGLRRAANLRWQSFDVTRDACAFIKGQRPAVLWFTGLSGAGKSAIANLVEKKLHYLGRHTALLDGDNIRHGLNKDLGFTDADRVENIRRVAEVARLMADAGLIVLVSFISPFRAERQMARELIKPGEFYEVFIDTPLAIAEQRDQKGLYKKARAGDLKNFTGIDSPYEAPDNPEVRIDTVATDPTTAAEFIVSLLTDDGRVDGGGI